MLTDVLISRDISNNEIKDVARDAFAGLSNLKSL